MEEIKTEHFLLRELRISDVDGIYSILCDEMTRRFLDLPEIKGRADVEKIVEDYLKQYREGKKYPFSIIEQKTDELIGVYLLKNDIYHVDCVEATVYLKREYQNKGVSTEVFPYMIDFAFHTLKTGYFRGCVMAGNVNSARLSEKFGFTYERTFTVDGLPGPINSYILKREDYFGIKE